MTIVSAKYEETGEPVEQDQFQLDYNKLIETHEKNRKSDPMWSFFGGMIYIENRTYQVC